MRISESPDLSLSELKFMIQVEISLIKTKIQ
jgi:hypothetical protein